MSNTKYTDPTNATNPPGGKHHDTGETDAKANRLPPEEGDDDADKKRSSKGAKAQK